MIKRILLITLGFTITVSGFWASQAQDPAPQNPKTDPPTVAAVQSTQTDLSGTYMGTFNCEPLGLTGDTTLTITGNEFTLADGRTGRLVTSTTRGYTAVALQLRPAATTGTGPTTAPPVISLRAKKKGDRLTLTSVGDRDVKCTFTPSRGRPTGAEVSNPAATPTESPMQTPSPSPSPMPSPTPEPNPSPSPTASPTPMPTPGEPTPSPTPGEPTPTPTPGEPTPSPTPSPSPRLGN